jgi:hypothetical protein
MVWALIRTNALTNSGVPMGTPTHFSPVALMMPRVQQDPVHRFYVDSQARGLVPEHKFANSLSADTGDVKFDFGHVETQFRVLSKPLANLDQHLEGCLEGGINVRIIGQTNPASTTMGG